MNLRAAFITACLLITSAVTPTSTQSATPLPTFSYDGDWEGMLVRSPIPDEGGSWVWTKNFDLKLSVSGERVRVLYRKDGEWKEVKPGAFVLLQTGTNAFVVSITGGSDEDGLWIESWAFALAPLDNTSIQASFQRIVNNTDMPRHNSDAVWGAFAYGELRRVQ